MAPADDPGEAGFNPPLGEVAFPTVELEPGVIVEQMLAELARNREADLDLEPGCGMRDSDPQRSWYPLVIVRIGEASWMVRPATARAMAVRIAADVRFEFHFDDRPALGLWFTKAADHAEALAAGKTAFTPFKELH
jgi:hypothetical protein